MAKEEDVVTVVPKPLPSSRPTAQLLSQKKSRSHSFQIKGEAFRNFERTYTCARAYRTCARPHILPRVFFLFFLSPFSRCPSTLFVVGRWPFVLFFLSHFSNLASDSRNESKTNRVVLKTKYQKRKQKTGNRRNFFVVPLTAMSARSPPGVLFPMSILSF